MQQKQRRTDFGCTVQVRLWPTTIPMLVKLSRPITVLPTELQNSFACDASHMRGLRLRVARCWRGRSVHVGGQEVPSVCRVGARASSLGGKVGRSERSAIHGARILCGSMRHCIAQRLIRAMTRCGVPDTVVAACVRDTHNTDLVFEHRVLADEGHSPDSGIQRGVCIESVCVPSRVFRGAQRSSHIGFVPLCADGPFAPPESSDTYMTLHDDK